MRLASGARALARALRSIALLYFFPAALAGQLPESALSVESGGRDIVWWRSRTAPTVWARPDPALARAVHWRRVRSGLDQARVDLSGEHAGWHVAVILARLDPARFTLRLDTAIVDGDPDWTVDSLTAGLALAVNAGQFSGGEPWGWLVRDGREVQPPGVGPLSEALVVDRNGAVSLVGADSIPAVRSAGTALNAFQSYPAILVADGVVPEPLRAPGRGVDLQHRDSRLALCMLRDGRMLFALTRFTTLGAALSRLPFGPTTPEMAAIMGALGCRRAVLLDGGLSGQLALRDERGRVTRWRGLRAVPLGLVALPRR